MKSDYGTPMSQQNKLLFYQLELDEAATYWSENIPERIIKKLKGEW